MEFQHVTKTNQPTDKREMHPAAKQVVTTRASVHPILQLQRAIGNQAVGRFIHAKLKIGQPGDIYEQEADRVAEMVMRMPDPNTTKGAAISGQIQVPHIRRISPGCDEEMRRQEVIEEPIKEEDETLQRKEMVGLTPGVAPSLGANLSSIKGGGQPLSEFTLAFFEPRFRYDFGQVRLHTDSRAAELARGVNALAFTLGHDIVFGAGQYAPESVSGRRLLAHELSHVVQQGESNGPPSIQRYDDPLLWCTPFMNLVEYEDRHGKLETLWEYNSLNHDLLIPLNRDIPSIYGDVDVDWMFRLAIIEEMFIIPSIFSPSMAEGFGMIASRLGYIGLKGFWNTVRAPFSEWDWEYESLLEEANWNAATVINDYIHHDVTLRDIFAPAIAICD